MSVGIFKAVNQGGCEGFVWRRKAMYAVFWWASFQGTGSIWRQSRRLNIFSMISALLII